ncbi:reverse transcriptase domain-containing protein [Tanacetum coccineum]
MDTVMFKASPPMFGSAENPNKNKFCTDEYIHMKKQIEEVVKTGQLSHLIKELKQGSNKGEHPKTAKKGEISNKEKPQQSSWCSCGSGDDGQERPMVIEAEVGGHLIHCMYVDGGSAFEVLYEHCFNRLRPEIKRQMTPSTTPLLRFSGEISWLLRKISLMVSLGDGKHSTRLRKIQAVPSTAYEMLKFLARKGIVTLHNSTIIPTECRMVAKPQLNSLPMSQQQKRSKVSNSPRVSGTNHHNQRKPIREMKDGTLRRDVPGSRHKLEGIQGMFGKSRSSHKTAVTKDAEISAKPQRKPGKKGSNQRSPVNGKRLEADADLFCQRCTTTTRNQLQLNGKTDTGSGIPTEEEIPETWTLFTDGSSCLEESGAGLILTNPEGMEFTYALRFKFVASNNEAEYEALMAGLRIVEQMGVKNLVAKVDSRLFANQINGLYIAKEQSMIQYLEKAKALVSGFIKFSIEQVSKSENKKADALSKIVSTSFAHLTKQAEYVMQESMKGLVACIPDQGPILEAQGKVKFLIVTIDYFTKWIEAKPVVTITGCQIKKFVWDNIVCKFGLPREIVSNNGKQFRDNPFKDWCDKLSIKQRFASVKHPQTNGLVERENSRLGEGIKARLDEGSKNRIKEVPHVLWAHRTMIKTNNRDTPFSLTYGTEAVIPVEIGMLTSFKLDLYIYNI